MPIRITRAFKLHTFCKKMRIYSTSFAQKIISYLFIYTADYLCIFTLLKIMAFKFAYFCKTWLHIQQVLLKKSLFIYTYHPPIIYTLVKLTAEKRSLFIYRIAITIRKKIGLELLRKSRERQTFSSV